MKTFMSREQAIQITVALLRITAGIMFMQAGGSKLFGWFGGGHGSETPPLLSQMGIGAILEFAGGILMTFGLFTRITAFIVSGEMAVAYWQFHAPKGTWPAENHGQAAVLYCFIFLFFAAYGAGEWSVDAMLQKNKTKRVSG